jgi:hypothetical protein
MCNILRMFYELKELEKRLKRRQHFSLNEFAAIAMDLGKTKLSEITDLIALANGKSWIVPDLQSNGFRSTIYDGFLDLDDYDAALEHDFWAIGHRIEDDR